MITYFHPTTLAVGGNKPAQDVWSLHYDRGITTCTFYTSITLTDPVRNSKLGKDPGHFNLCELNLYVAVLKCELAQHSRQVAEGRVAPCCH